MESLTFCLGAYAAAGFLYIMVFDQTIYDIATAAKKLVYEHFPNSVPRGEIDNITKKIGFVTNICMLFFLPFTFILSFYYMVANDNS